MRFIRTKAVIATVGLALSLAACGDAGDDGGETADVEVAGERRRRVRRRHAR